MAILEKNELTACFLISADMTLQMRHGYDRTELFLAACMGLRRVVKLLLSSTAFFAYPPQKWVSDAKAAVRVALYMGNTEVVDMIRRNLGLYVLPFHPLHGKVYDVILTDICCV